MMHFNIVFLVEITLDYMIFEIKTFDFTWKTIIDNKD